uniref:G_PROTEIN_RECEP_F1_2 domain-containing protein n=1 Tax=Strongyloides papillosus TaxID=174720 RepID=A0A0N5C122_STREA
MVIGVVEIIQLSYLIPSLILMMFVACILLHKILKQSKTFQNEFYPMVCYRTFNDILYNVCILFMLKFPSWLIMPQYYLDSVHIAPIYYVLAASTFCAIFVHSIFLSVIRYVAIYYPGKYTRISSSRTSIILCCLLFLISFGVGLPTLAFPSKYIYNNATNTVLPAYAVKSITYYNFGYAIVFYGSTVILSAIFNVANLIGLSKNNKKNKNKRSENVFAFYTLFTLFTTSLMEAYFCCRISGNFFGNQKLLAIANYSVIWIGDIGTLGHFYFFVFINSEIRATIKEIFCKVFGIKYAPSLVKTTEIIKSIYDSKSLRSKNINRT